MSPDTMMLLFSIIIFFFGIYTVLAAVQMKRSKKPPSMLLPQDGKFPPMGHDADQEAFCNALYVPTAVFGLSGCLYGALEAANQYWFQISAVKPVGIVLFLAVCAWYMKKVGQAREDYGM